MINTRQKRRSRAGRSVATWRVAQAHARRTIRVEVCGEVSVASLPLSLSLSVCVCVVCVCVCARAAALGGGASLLWLGSLDELDGLRRGEVLPSWVWLGLGSGSVVGT